MSAGPRSRRSVATLTDGRRRGQQALVLADPAEQADADRPPVDAARAAG